MLVSHLRVKLIRLKSFIFDKILFQKIEKKKKLRKDYTKNVNINVAQSAGAVEYTDCFSADGEDLPPPATSVLDVTQNNLMVRFQ